jgi:rhomboid protease GluP
MGSYSTRPDSPAHPPEVLPPSPPAATPPPEDFRGVTAHDLAQRSQQGPGPRAGLKSWAFAPATYTLLGINVAVFLAMAAAGVSVANPTVEQLLRFGANNPERVLYYGEWYRIVTAMFVHVGLIHLASNMWCLWNLGLLGEPLIGPLGVFAAYILSGAAGNLLSVAVNTYFHENSVGAGASGAVFGIAGVLIVLLKSKRLPIPPRELSGLRRYVIYFAAINFVIGFGSMAVGSVIHIDNMAHLGGFLGGILFSLPLVPLIGSPRPLFLFRRRVAIGLVCAVLVFFGVFLSNAFPR